MDKSALTDIVNIKYIIPPLWRYYSTIKIEIQSNSLYFITYSLYTVFAFLFTIRAGGDPLDIRHYDTWVKIGLNILYYRKEQKLTQAQLAEMTGDGISMQFLQRIETAAASCSVDTLIDIAKALGIPLCKLFEFKK